MGTQRAYITGFVKRANEHGLTNNQAIQLLKEADSSWLGRYLAADTVPHSIMQNKAVILNELDPDGSISRENLFLNSDQYKKQRELAYNHVRNTIRRSASAGPGKNFLLGGAFGGLIGAGEGAVISDMYHNNPLAGAAVGGLAGGLTIGSLAALSNIINRMKERKVTDEDIARMREYQKNNSFAADQIPFKNMIDAYKAGKNPELAKKGSDADAPVANIQAPSIFSGALGKIKNMFGNTKPSLPPKPQAIPVRQFGMTNNALQAAQNQMENSGQVDLAGG